ncbi:MAG: SDR family oxidoreductase [Candidatus Eiseniibacteriota bacterium]|jgi:3-oxoacyl-[acyl-carrier protein] reductase
MKLGLEGRTALVGGASSGIGKAIAGALLDERANVVIVARDAKRLEAAARDLERRHGRAAMPVTADLTDAAAIEGLLERAHRRYETIDILVANAGGPPSGPFEAHDDDAWEAAFRLNLLSGVRLARALLPGMREQRWGRIVFLTSLTVKQPEPGLILSNSVRAGVSGLAKTLSQEVAADGITVNSVCPGLTDTERLQALARANAERDGVTPDDVQARWLAAIPAGRLGRPEEVGDAVAFLASERAAYITGVALLVDGGYVKGL